MPITEDADTPHHAQAGASPMSKSSLHKVGWHPMSCSSDARVHALESSDGLENGYLDPFKDLSWSGSGGMTG